MLREGFLLTDVSIASNTVPYPQDCLITCRRATDLGYTSVGAYDFFANVVPEALRVVNQLRYRSHSPQGFCKSLALAMGLLTFSRSFLYLN